MLRHLRPITEMPPRYSEWEPIEEPQRFLTELPSPSQIRQSAPIHVDSSTRHIVELPEMLPCDSAELVARLRRSAVQMPLMRLLLIFTPDDTQAFVLGESAKSLTLSVASGRS